MNDPSNEGQKVKKYPEFWLKGTSPYIRTRAAYLIIHLLI